MKDHFPEINLIVAFKSPFTIGNFFPFKDKVPSNLLSKVVYCLSCINCDSSYVGKTSRNICVRLSEHQAQVHNNDSSVMKHMRESGHTIDWNWKILDKADTDQKLLLKEMLHINKRNPKLNVQKSSELFTLLIGNNKVKH